MWTVAIFVGAYFALLGVLSLIVRGQRFKLVSMLQEFKASNMFNERELSVFESMNRTAYSIRVAPMVTLSFLQGLLATPEGIAQESKDFQETHPNIASSNQAHEFIDAYLASVAAINPLFGMLMYVSRHLWGLKRRLAKRTLDSQSFSANLPAFEAAARA